MYLQHLPEQLGRATVSLKCAVGCLCHSLSLLDLIQHKPALAAWSQGHRKQFTWFPYTVIQTLFQAGRTE